MSRPLPQVRFAGPAPSRAKPIPQAQWDHHKMELQGLYDRMKLEDVMALMKVKHKFEPSRRQYIYQFEKWGFAKYNTAGRDIPLQTSAAEHSPYELSTSAPATLPARFPPAPPPVPKRPKSMGSLHGCGSRSSTEKPRVPPKKRQKLVDYMSSREALATPSTAGPTAPTPCGTSPVAGASRATGAPSRVSLIGQALASTHALPVALEYPARSSIAHTTSDIVSLAEDDGDWISLSEGSDSDPLLPEIFNGADNRIFGQTSSLPTRLTPGSRRRFDSSRPVHTFSQQELVDMKMAAAFLRALGFAGDAFELITILLKQLKEGNSEPAWLKSSALIDCVRSASSGPQVEIARNELLKALDEPRESFTDVEHFVYRMLLAETYSRSEEKYIEDSVREIAIGCELANDRMLDSLPDDHRLYDIVTYHYLNRCLEYLNSFVKDDWDQGSIFTDKEHLQIRILERIPGPFELRHGHMKKPCLRSCLSWCEEEFRSMSRLLDPLQSSQGSGNGYLYWTEHITLYCALWERWQARRRDCFGSQLATWMQEAENQMGLTPAQLLSIVCGMIIGTALPRTSSLNADLVSRGQNAVRAISRLTDKDLGCQFLETYSLLGTLLGPPPRQEAHDLVSFFATLINSTREHEAIAGKARKFVRDFIESDMNIILPVPYRDPTPDRASRDSQTLSPHVSNTPMMSMTSLAAAILPTLASSSIHSSDLAAMQSLKDRIERTDSNAIARIPSWGATWLASQSQTSIPTVCELSRAMESSLSLSSAQRAANAALDAVASAASGVLGMMSNAELDGNPFSEKYGEVV
ncbi:hypothetical protein BCR34DRAFT_568226 [Clohesyomyces aquaticus]|uniref:Clr5 domain-containing protein n=1 Tax=Clohesyomyces aquaticus TaxID=1231657 RepID=A0A1Y1ZH89_9PLEO|nr:hypothetical protein BCR34DRAFT_568226 [Clohesyomyces aquaticus]